MGNQYVRANPKFRLANPRKDTDEHLPKLKPIVFNYLRQKGFIKNLIPDKLELVPIMGKNQSKDIKEVEDLRERMPKNEKAISEKVIGDLTKDNEKNDEPTIGLDGFTVRVKQYPNFGLTFTKKK
jgi:hypothetical protein